MCFRCCLQTSSAQCLSERAGSAGRSSPKAHTAGVCARDVDLRPLMTHGFFFFGWVCGSAVEVLFPALHVRGSAHLAGLMTALNVPYQTACCRSCFPNVHRHLAQAHSCLSRTALAALAFLHLLNSFTPSLPVWYFMMVHTKAIRHVSQRNAWRLKI